MTFHHTAEDSVRFTTQELFIAGRSRCLISDGTGLQITETTERKLRIRRPTMSLHPSGFLGVHC